jgi:hypothetical protein
LTGLQERTLEEIARVGVALRFAPCRLVRCPSQFWPPRLVGRPSPGRINRSVIRTRTTNLKKRGRGSRATRCKGQTCVPRPHRQDTPVFVTRLFSLTSLPLTRLYIPLGSTALMMRRRAFDVCIGSRCDWSKKEMFPALGLQVNSPFLNNTRPLSVN